MVDTQSHNIMFLICFCLFFEEFLLILCLLVKEDTTCDHDGTDSTKDTDFITKHQHWQPNQNCPLHCIGYTKTTKILILRKQSTICGITRAGFLMKWHLSVRIEQRNSIVITHIITTQIWVVFFRQCGWNKFSIYQKPRGGGVLPCMGYIGMCRCEGYDFEAVYSRIGYINQCVWV